MKKFRRSISFDMFVIYFGLFVVCSAHYSLLHLQSSLNVEDGLGVASVTANYAAVLVGGVFMTSTFLLLFDMKIALVVTDVTYLFFVAANFYPRFYTLVPASVICGFGKILFWVAFGAYNVFFAKALAKRGKKELKSYISTITGFFVCSFQISQIAGNLISFAIFSVNTQSENLSNHTDYINSTNSEMLLVGICGANDCQDPNITNQNLSNYKPSNENIVYIVLGLFLALNGLGLFLHAFFGPQSTKTYAPRRKDLKVEINHNYSENFDEVDVQSKTSNDSRIVSSFSSEESEYNLKKDEKFTWLNAWHGVKGGLRQFVKPLQILLLPINFQVGFYNAFSSSEVTRAYASCVFGVSQVGLSMAITAVCAMVSSAISGQICSRFGRQYPIALSCVLNCGLMTYCLLWKPSYSSTVWEIYPIMFLQGISSGCAMTGTQVTVVELFPENTPQAFSVWATTSSSGALVQFAWSTSLCVREKIYAMYGVTLISAITYVLAEFFFRKSARKKDSETQMQVTAM